MHLRKYWCNPFLLIEKIRHFKLWTDFTFYLLYTYLPSRRNLHIENSCSIFVIVYFISFIFQECKRKKEGGTRTPAPTTPGTRERGEKARGKKTPEGSTLLGGRHDDYKWTGERARRRHATKRRGGNSVPSKQRQIKRKENPGTGRQRKSTRCHYKCGWRHRGPYRIAQISVP